MGWLLALPHTFKKLTCVGDEKRFRTLALLDLKFKCRGADVKTQILKSFPFVSL
jgi:hypothetical protein